MIMSGPQRVSGEAFAVERLREAPNLDYAKLRAEAVAAGISMQPIHYGRARRQLGLPVLRDSREAPAEQASAETMESLPAAALHRAGPAAIAPSEAATNATRATANPAGPAAPPRKGSAAFELLLQELRADATLSYATLRDRAAGKGFTIAPIMYGRAKAVLGLVPVKPRTSKKSRAAAAAATQGAPPMQFKQVESVAADRFSKQLDDARSLDHLVAVVKDLDAERRRLRSVLEKVVTMIDEVLG